MKMKIHIILLISVILLVSIVAPIVSSENDPGHDILYIEEQGDSELNGTLNITSNLSVNGGKIKQGGVLTLYADDTLPGTGTYISATSTNNLYLDAQGNIYLKYNIGGDAVYIGNPGAATDLNVSGALYIQSGTATVGGQGICLANGTNCPGEGTGDISSVQSDNIYIYNGSDSGQVYLLFNETKLNETIEERATAVGDGNNYTSNISISNGTTHTITINRQGMTDLITTFTDIGATYTAGNDIDLSGGGTQIDLESTLDYVGTINPTSGVLTINGNISMPTNFYIGNSATATGSDSMAIGGNAEAIGARSAALGRGAITNGDFAVALGDSANASEQSIAIGSSAKTQSYSAALGPGATTTGLGATAVGYQTNASAYSIAVGEYAKTTGTESISLGYAANATADYAIAIGSGAQATAQDAIAIGRGTINNAANSTLFGGAIIVTGDINVTGGGDVCLDGGTCLSTISNDGNNYTSDISVTNTSTHTITISRTGMSDLITTFTDIDTNTGNCSVDQSCPLILYDTNASDFYLATNPSGYITAAQDQNNYTTSIGINTTGLTKQINIAINGRPNITASFVDNDTDTTGGNLSAIGATAGYIPRFQNGSLVNNSLMSQSENVLTVSGNISQNDNYYHCFGNDCDSYIYYNGTSMIIKVT